MCIPTGFICDIIGRKRTLLSLLIPFTAGWLLIIFASDITMIYFGRLITGMAAGACCIAAPLYTSEIAHKSLRGTLGSYFQLMVTAGIFLAYLFGKYLNPNNFTIWCASIPFLFVIMFAFQPESPTYLMKGKKDVQAKQVLTKLRGENYNVVAELIEIEGSIKESSQTAVSLKETFSQKNVIKALLISMALMFLQQFSGINTIILYTTEIFKASGMHFDPKDASILIGGVQVAATFVSSLVVDRLGRRILLIISGLFIAKTTLVLGIYFTLKYRSSLSADIITQLGFIPIGALSIFMVAYSLGLGPIPWVISSEIFPTEIKSISSSTAGTVNWFLAFILTKFYLQIVAVIGQDSTFYIFSFFSALGVLFIYFVVPETKGKTTTEIQLELRN